MFAGIVRRFWLVIGIVALTSPLMEVAHADQIRQVANVGMDHYRGKWLEIGRTPMFLTNGCVAGYSTYTRGKLPDEVMVEDGCRMGSPSGQLKTIHGSGVIRDFGKTNARMRVRYPFLITFNYWVLYRSPDRSWFISATPDRNNLWIYARSVPTGAQLRRMTRKAGELGYDVRKLEFPAQ